MNELTSQLERKEASSVDKHKIHLAETKIRQLESRLELETAAKIRAEANCNKSKEQLDSLKDQLQNLQAVKERETEILKRLQQQHSHQQDAVAAAQRREADLAQKQRDLVCWNRVFCMLGQGEPFRLIYSSSRLRYQDVTRSPYIIGSRCGTFGGREFAYGQ